ncbi:MAG TPA: hypothetical protein DCQ06_00440, partial [Myxococcales bacterium]|nr:hypothetical protein [Myxococcales bacterium]
MKFGSWSLIERIAEGGGGQVWRVEHIDSGHRAVLKIASAQHPHQGHALYREYLSLTAVPCATLPAVIEWLPPGLDGRAGLVMQERQGLPLSQALQDADEDRVLVVIDQALSALMALHAAGLVHGDLHPGNWLMNGEGQLSLLDLGLAQRPGQTPAWGAGLPYFAAPERLRGEGTAASDDLFSLAMTLWDALGAGAPWPD